MFMHWLFCYVMEKSFDLPFLVFTKRIEDELVKEIDFRHEAANAEICRENFKKCGRKDVYIPRIYGEYTTKRSLVLEWIDGIKITNQEELQKKGISVKEVL